MSEEIVELEQDSAEEKLEQDKNNSVSSFVLSMIGLAFMPTVVGLLVMGILSLVKAKNVSSNFKKAPYRALANIGKGFAIFEIILACVAVAAAILYLFIWLIVVIATAASYSGSEYYLRLLFAY